MDCEANRERAYARSVCYREKVEAARERGESDSHSEEMLNAALVLAELNHYL